MSFRIDTRNHNKRSKWGREEMKSTRLNYKRVIDIVIRN